MKLNLVTGNQYKVKEFKAILKPEFEIEHIDFDYPELRSDDPEEIILLASKQLAEELNKPIIVEDSGFFIKALNDFPGTCTAYIHQRIGVDGTLKLMEGIKDRTIFYKSAIGYCKPGQDAVSFLGIEEGTMATEARGEFGWGQDPVFIPEGNDKTYGEIRKEGDVNIFRKKALEKLKEFLLKNK